MRLGWCALLALLCAGCAGESDETYALVVVANADPPVGPITRIELRVAAGARMASHDLIPPSGTLTMPTSVSLHADGGGPLEVTAIAYGESGVLERGSRRTTLQAGEVNRIEVTLGRHESDGDGGVGEVMLVADAVDFGTLATGQRKTLGVDIRNAGTQASAPLTVELSGAPFALGADGCRDQFLAPGASCSVEVSFAPTTAQGHDGTLTVGGTLPVMLHGRGVDPGAIAVDPMAISFGSTVVDQPSAVRDITVSNTGAIVLGNLDVAISGTDAAQFSIGSNQCQDQGLAAGATCKISVQFQPRAVGAWAATLTVSETGGATNTVTLTGQGVTASALVLTGDGMFGSVQLGASSTSDAVFTVTNSGGIATGTLSTALTGANRGDFAIVVDSCATHQLATRSDCSVRVSFTPGGPGPRTAKLTVSGTPGGQVEADLSGNGQRPASLTLLPAMHSFGMITVGNAATQIFTLSNGGDVAGTFVAPATSAPFAIVDNRCTSPLAGMSGCNVTIEFRPSSATGASGMLTVGPLRADLTGTGVAAGALSIGPTGLTFTDTILGQTTASQRLTVTNTGGAPTGVLAAPSIQGSGAASFEIESDGCVGRVLGQGSSCDLLVRFHPAAAGSQSASLSVSASPGGATSASLSGRGLAPASLTVAPISAFGDVIVGTASVAQTVTVSNGGDVPTAVAVALSVTGPNAGELALSMNGCTGVLAARGSCTAKVTLTPTSAGNKTAQLVASAGSLSAMTGLAGRGVTQAALSIAPTSQNFGAIPRATAGADVLFTVRNDGDSPSGPLTVTLPSTDFALTATTSTCGPALAGHTSCALNVHFQPQTAGAKSATLTVSAGPGGSPSAALSGTGQVPALLGVDAPASYDFSRVETGSLAAHTFVIRNSGDLGTGTLTIGALAAPYSRTSNCPTSLASMTSCNVVVIFAPSAPGAAMANLQVTASPGGTVTLAMTGSGVTCLSSARCTASTTPICDGAAYSCRACAGDSECAQRNGAAAPACRSDGACVRCTTAAHCGGGLQCLNNTSCVQCLSSAHCTSSSTAPICGTNNACRACSSNAECQAKNPGSPYCAGGECVQCTSSSHCVGSEICFANYCTCPNPCTNSRCGSWPDCHGEYVDCGDDCQPGTCTDSIMGICEFEIP